MRLFRHILSLKADFKSRLSHNRLYNHGSMKLLLPSLVSLFLGSCAVKPLTQSTYKDPEYKCKIWLEYHEECVKEITKASDNQDLTTAENYARDVRKAILEEIDYSAISPERKKFFMREVEIAKGKAVLAATRREEEIGN